MPRLSRATSFAGTYHGTPVHLVGGHDTASAVAALPSPQPNAGFISSGTWMLVGAEREAADTSPAAMRANFSNEPGVFGSGPGNVRFLKNVMGLWMLEQCRMQWGNPPLQQLLVAADELPVGGPIVDATHPRFLAPHDMEADVRTAARLPTSASRAAVARCILDSLAVTATHVLKELGSLTGDIVSEVIVVGGGARNSVLNRYISEASGLPLRAGAAEATLLGNALVQGIALGMFESLAEARTALPSSIAPRSSRR
jgi:rhamnulokinase